MGVVVVIRDDKGLIIAALSKPIQALHDPASAEAVATLSAVEFCKDVGVHDIMVKAINDPRPNWLRYGHLVDDIQDFGIFSQLEQ